VHVSSLSGYIYRGGVWGAVTARLDVGVAIFFSLSGFLLWRPFAAAVARGDRRRRFGRYLWRRAVRILPALWIMLAVVLTTLPDNARLPKSVWLHYFTLTQTFIFDGGFDEGLVPLWSLTVEALFYLVLPILVVFLLTRRWRPVRTVVLIVLVTLASTIVWLEYRAAQIVHDNPQGYRAPSFAIWFGVGMALSTIHVALRTGTAPRSWRVFDDLARAPMTCWGMAAALIFFISTPLGGPIDFDPITIEQTTLHLFVYGAVAALVLLPVAFGPQNQFKNVLESRPFRWLGEVSYGVFLWHLWVLIELYRIEKRPTLTGDPVSAYVITLAVSLVIASISWYALERPLLTLTSGARRRGRLGNDRQPQHAQTQQTGQLRPEAPMLVVSGVAEPAPNGKQRDGKPQLYRA
jgi:peptidoglycan/LPS O-acetylase OafA/YrhL